MDYSPIAEFYALNYAGYTDDFDYYGRLAQDYGGPVLELGAGTGRISAALGRRGVEVWALEPAEGMRKLGQKQTRNLPVKWRAGDMRSFDLGRQFPLIIAPFNAFMHLYTLEDQDATLRNILAHLETGGRLAFDLYNPAHIGPSGVLQHEGTYGDLRVFIHQDHQPVVQSLLTHYLLDRTTPSGSLKRQHHTLTQRYFTRYEIERWLRAFGLKFRVFGGFYKEPLEADSAVFVFEAWKSTSANK